MIFCAAVFIKQIRFLHKTDLGINRRNVAAVQAPCCRLTSPYYAEQIKQIPGIKDALPIAWGNYFLANMTSGGGISSYEKDGEKMTYSVFNITAVSHFFEFFGVEIISGTIFPNEFDNYKFVLNETAMREIGEKRSKAENFMGVARDFYLSPTTKVKPTQISYPDPKYNFLSAIAYKYEEGMRQQTEEAVKQWYRKEFPDQGEFAIDFAYMEDIFEEYFKSEQALLTLLLVMTFACILIAVFGVYSLTSLTCEQRRKEIAIRKINGAAVVDIMNIFFKEYLLLLAMAALVAFPAGYIIMKRWLEGYVKQTSLDAWLYVLIFLIVFVVIVFSIVSMVWKAANQNPAEVVKGE
jgi:succinate dehydrogenase hydrophobic anchor subunit